MISSSMRFALGISAVFALAALVAGGVSYALQAQDLQRRLEEDVARTAQSLAQTQDPQDLAELVSALAATPDRAVVVDWQGADGTRLGNLQAPERFEGPRHLPGGPEGPDGYVAYGLTLPSGWLMVGRDDAWITESREVLLQTTAWGLGAALVLSVALALAVARRNEARIAHMQAVLLAVRAGDHGARIGAAGSDDLARVAQEVDQTLDRLEAGMAAIRQVSTDVAHDLRAPLARLRLRLEPLPGAGPALEEVDAISATFDAILRLARLQSRTVELETEPHDLGALTREASELFDPAPSLELPGAPVVAEVDHGPGIPEVNRARVLQRFTRLDRSRTTPGTGLGLAMVAAIAACHDGTLRLEDNHPGLRATLALPRLAPGPGGRPDTHLMAASP